MPFLANDHRKSCAIIIVIKTYCALWLFFFILFLFLEQMEIILSDHLSIKLIVLLGFKILVIFILLNHNNPMKIRDYSISFASKFKTLLKLLITIFYIILVIRNYSLFLVLHAFLTHKRVH